jgi:hemolysin activation/secretion protein
VGLRSITTAGGTAWRRLATAARAAAALGLLAAAPALAQMPPPPPPGSPIPAASPPAKLPVGPGLAPSGRLENLAPATARKVTSVVVEGSTIFPQAELDAAAKGLVGDATPTSAIEQARLDLLKKYRDGGYPLVTVSASLAADGKLRFTITEGRIAEVLLDGDIGPAGNKVLAFLHHLVRPGPVKALELERWLLLAQDVPGVALQSVLRPSESEPGALTLVARVRRSTFSGFLAADNRAYRYTGPEEALGLLGINSLTSLGERTELSLYRSIRDSSQIFGQGAFETFIGSSGLKIRLYGGAGDTQPTGQLRAAGYDGQTIIAGGQLTYPLIDTRRQKLNIVGVFDAIQYFVYNGSPATLTSKDSLRVVRVGIDYALQDILLGDGRPAVNQASVRLAHGLDIFGASAKGTSTLGRQFSDPQFTKVSIEVSRNQTLFQVGKESTVSLYGLVTGQASGDIIPSAEKFYLGGQRFTRGFYSGEVTGDNALAATAELQFNTGVKGELFGSQWDVGLQFYGFYDWGETWENKALDFNKRLASFGLGLRSTITPRIEIDLEVLQRLTRHVDGAGVKPLPKEAFFWRLLARF